MRTQTESGRVSAPGAWRARGVRRLAGRVGALLALGLALVGADREVFAYSYAAAGAEPLIDAREATLAALESRDAEAARAASAEAEAELRYLDEHYGTEYGAALQVALESGDAGAVDRVYLEAFATEVRRRVAAAQEVIAEYQNAKALVVRSKRFLDLLAPHLPEAERAQALEALAGCLEAVGNPGVFGVGQEPADPEAFASSAQRVLESLEAL